MCWYPLSLNASHTKDGEYLPPRLVPCGKCIACLQKKRADWTFRIRSELNHARKAYFLTLTLNDDFIKKKNGIPTLEKSQLQDYFKRLRHETTNLKYYAVGEYGGKNGRPHYHAIIFNASADDLHSKWSINGTHMGRTSQDPVNLATIHYVTGYIMSKYGEVDKKTGVAVDTFPPGIQKPFALMSKGLGKSYANENAKYHLSNETFQTKNFGQTGYLSRYLKMKIFHENELLRLKITEEQAKEIMNDLKQKSTADTFTARKYYKVLHEHAQKLKNL